MDKIAGQSLAVQSASTMAEVLSSSGSRRAATLLNLLSVGAAYGLLVLVLQKGVGNELLGLQQVATIEAWLPVFLFSILFGLSMDY